MKHFENQYCLQLLSLKKGSASAPLRSWRWDGATPLLCDPSQGMLIERIGNQAVLRVLSTRFIAPYRASAGDLLQLSDPRRSLTLLTPDGRSQLRVLRLQKLHAVVSTELELDSDEAAEVLAARKVWVDAQDADYLDSKKGFRKVVLGVVAACLVLGLSIRFMDLTGSGGKGSENEELIPQQVARLILKSSTTSQTVASSRAQRAVHSPRVQRSLHRLVGKGLASVSRALASSMSFGGSVNGLLKAQDGISGGLRTAALEGSLLGNVEKTGEAGGYGKGAGNSLSVGGQGRSLVTLNTDQAQVEEGLTKEEVARVIHSHLSEVRYCYESAILKNSHLEGKVVIDFKVASQGSVGDAREKETTLSDVSVGSCVLRRLLEWKFPKPRGGVVVAVSYPFLFKTVKRE